VSGLENFVNAAAGSASGEQTFYGAEVTGMNSDGTVDLRYLGEDHPGIDCLSSYTNRVSGDLVVVRSDGVHWIVMGKLGNEVDSSPNLSWGNGNPYGSDWAVATDIRVRPGQVYIKGTALAADNYTVTPQAIIEQQFDRAFQSNSWNHAFSGRPAQGVEEITGLFGSGAWSGGWYYQSDIFNAVQAKTVRSMEFRIERGAEPWGLDEAVTPWIYAHNDSVQGTSLSFVLGPYAGTPLQIGQSAWWQVPQVMIDMFNAGTAKGFGVSSSKPEEFMVFADMAGDVRIYN